MSDEEKKAHIKAKRAARPKKEKPTGTPPSDKAPGIKSRQSSPQIGKTTDKLFKALASSDWERAEECFAPKAQLFSPQRVGATAQTFLEFKKTMGGMIGLLGNPKYSNVKRFIAPNAVTAQHTTRFSKGGIATADDTSAEACVIFRFNDAGLITRMDEYLDPTRVLKAAQTAMNVAKLSGLSKAKQ